MENQTDVVATRLETARRELLDLGLRNPLLNYRLLRSRGLEVVDELPAEVFRTLVQDGRTMSFLPALEDGAGDSEGQPEGEEPGQPAARHTGTRLQTGLSSAELQTRLLSTYHLANTFIQEQGVNTLFLALGMVNWYESDSSQEARRAPLLLIPVELQRTNVKDRFHLQHTGDDIGENLSLREKARTEFGITFPELPEVEDLEMAGYLDAVGGAIEPQPRWWLDRASVVLGFFSFGRFLMYRDLDVEIWPEDAKPTAHPVVSALLDAGFDEPASEVTSDDNLDEYLSPQDVHHVVDADSSQVLALLDVNQGRNLVVQGPPGTGKSQTITNMIAEALGAGRTVLFVSEKMAALEVVKRRLDGIGLGDACLELHSNKTAKKAVLDELARTLDLGRPMLGDIEADFDELTRLRDRLNAYCDAIRVPVGDSGVNPYRALGELIRLRKDGEGAPLPKLDITDLQSWSEADFRRRLGVVAELQVRVAAMGVPQEHVFWGSRRTTILPTDLDRLRDALAAAQGSLESMVDAVTSLAVAMELPVPIDPSGAQALGYGAYLAIRAPDLSGLQLRSQEWEGSREDLRILLAAGSDMHRLHQEYDPVLIPSAWGQDLLEVRQVFATKGRKLWRLLSGEYRRAKSRLTGLCRTVLPSGIDAQIELADAVLEERRQRAVLEQHQSLGARAFGVLWKGEGSDWASLTQLFEWIEGLHRDVDAGRAPEGIIDFVDQGRSVEGLEALAAAVEQATGEHSQKAALVGEILDLDVVKRFGTGPDVAAQNFDIQREALERWLGGIQLIHEIVSLNNIAATCKEEGLEPVLTVAESWPDAGQRIADAFSQTWFEGLLERALEERPAFSGFDGVGHRQALEKFRGLDSLVLEHNRARLALAHWERLPRQGAAGQLGVLRREFEKRRRHLPIRQLMERAGNAVQAIKPVFMMSPLSIANYLAPGSVKFDLVIFDEASQVRPVDAFGAILRAGQTVVVGDSQQLPPTNFFESAAQDRDDDDDSATADIESVLGLFASKGAPNKMLRWHYRSRHESLIAVSNQEFYNNNLLIFPSPDAGREEVGLRFHHLADTVYDRGGSSTNVEEAKLVAQAVMDHARDHPDMTLGVAAFSVKQTQVILDQLEMLRRQNPAHEEFFNTHPHEPFFVKNLETVQGDERDVIFISIGYGRESNGRIGMNFGPLNTDGGERRLNVLITRARRRCEVFTNLTADDIDLSRTNSRGVRALKVYLAYAQHGTLESSTQSGRESGSPFQDAVASAVSNLGFDVRQEIGSAGYFIDLAVVDQDRPGRYLLGIECDGATYHSSRYARDRDRLRQQVLEGLGWRIHRVWSTDWFRNPERELSRVAEAIEAAKTPPVEDDAAPEADSSIEREFATGVIHEEEDGITEYLRVDLEVLPGDQELHALPTSTLASWVAEVVHVESPVHVSEVSRRIADAAGVRLSRRLQDALASAVHHSEDSSEVRREGDFLWRGDMESPELRDRSNVAPASRKLELVAPEELALAVARIVAGSYGIHRQEVPGAAVRLLGFARLTQDMRTRVDSIVDEMVQDGRLAEQGENLMAGEEQPDAQG